MLQSLSNLFVRLPILDRSVMARQLVKFGVVGVTNTFWDFFLYLVLTRGWLGFELHFLLANILAFLFSVVNSYILNKTWTFRNRDTNYHVQFGKFFLVNVVTLALYELLLYLFIDGIGMYDIYAKILAIIPVMLWNFTANRVWTFRSSTRQTPTDTARS